MSDTSKFNECWSRIEHYNSATQLKQVYEWVKTGHINLEIFRGLISKIHAE